MDWSLLSSLVAFRRWFWSESFWLPANVTWKDLEADGGGGGGEGHQGDPGAPSSMVLPSAYDLLLSVPLAVALFGLRLIWERCVAQPLGRLKNFKETPLAKPQPNEILEKAFSFHGKISPDHKKILGYAKQLDWTPHQVQRWWRKRRMLGKPSQMQRFKETCWRFIFYLCAFWSGLYILWDKSWFWDLSYCWQGYPRQHIPSDIWWYYMIELAFYLSLVLSLFRDVRRKDFREMILHHFTAISLLSLSWSNNMVRVGTLVLCLHDTVDYWLEGAKLALYCKCNKLCNAMFVVFTVLWFTTRLIIFPFRIIHNTMFEGHLVVGLFPMYYMFNVLLCTLLFLNIVWFCMILRMFYQYVIHGKIEKDNRSDTESEVESDDGAVANSNMGDGDSVTVTSFGRTTVLTSCIDGRSDGTDGQKNCVSR